MVMELPSDLIEEILSRVPARSLVRLRYTCKQWDTLIAKQRFVHKHLSHKSCREQQFTVFYNKHIVSPLLGGFMSYVGIDFNKPELCNLELPFSIPSIPMSNIIHCDGLLLYVSRSMLMVSNPMFKQERWIRYSEGFGHYMDVFGLGYISNQSSSSYDYKVVRIGCGGRFEDSTRVEVYSFKSDSWKVIVDKTFGGFFGLPWSSVCLRGTPYWLGYNKDGNKLESIQSFDFLTERFEPLFLPPSSTEPCKFKKCQSLGIFRGDQLSLFECHATGKINFWVMKKQHWSRHMTVDAPQISIDFHHLSSFIESNGRLAIFNRNGQNNIYIVGENQDYQNIGCFSRYGYTFCDSCYVPSLLQVPGVSRLEDDE